MIQPQDLRLGNWIKTNIYQQVTIEILEFLLNENMNHFVIQPIPLTIEVLTQHAGFYMEDEAYHASGNYEFKLYFNEEQGDFRYNRNDYHSTSVTELHQLQNLYYALYGEELKINL